MPARGNIKRLLKLTVSSSGAGLDRAYQPTEPREELSIRAFPYVVMFLREPVSACIKKQQEVLDAVYTSHVITAGLQTAVTKPPGIDSLVVRPAQTAVNGADVP